MSRRSKDPSYDRHPEERKVIVIACAVLAVFGLGMALIISGLAR